MNGITKIFNDPHHILENIAVDRDLDLDGCVIRHFFKPVTAVVNILIANSQHHMKIIRGIIPSKASTTELERASVGLTACHNALSTSRLIDVRANFG